jgi:REG-2-like HAD superfamily hydrolase
MLALNPVAKSSMKASAETLAMTFDVGGTLIEPWPSVGHIYAEVAARHGGKGISVETLNRRFGAAWPTLRNFNHTRAEWAALVTATFGSLLNGPPSEACFDELYARFAEPSAWRVFEDVQEALERLASGGLKLGIISNWDERLRPLLRDLKLDDYFEVILISQEIGFTKPSRVIFELAAEKLALPPESILHVGDSLELDAQGARAAGFQAALLDRAAGAVPGAAGETGRKGAPPGWARIGSLRDLGPLLVEQML